MDGSLACRRRYPTVIVTFYISPTSLFGLKQKSNYNKVLAFCLSFPVYSCTKLMRSFSTDLPLCIYLCTLPIVCYEVEKVKYFGAEEQ